jgi:hypothetical protein
VSAFANSFKRGQSAISCLLFFSPVFAQDVAPDSYTELESKYIFGFTEGSDIGFEGERAIVSVTTALAYRLAPNVVLGGELEYYRAHNSLGFGDFAGHALYVGPTLFVQLTNKILLRAAFSTEIAGHAVGESGPLDLTNFSRNKALLYAEFEF